MLHIEELGVSVGVDNQKNFIGKKDGTDIEIKIISLPKEDVRQGLLKICSELKEPSKLIENTCENKKCKKTFFSKRTDAKYCSDKCRQSVKYYKSKGE